MIHAAINYMQIWVELRSEADKDKMKEMARCLTEWMGMKAPYLGHSSDIMVMYLSVLCFGELVCV